MKKTVVAIALVSVAFFAACNNEAETDTQGTYPATEAAVEEDHAAQGVSLSTTSGETIDPSAAAPAPPAAAAAGGVKLNPPHGEPGHRCEIPVGAPLDSDPINGSDLAQQQLIQDHAQPAAPQPMPTGGQTARLNPPHGQPGHDCAVAVGAPLP